MCEDKTPPAGKREKKKKSRKHEENLAGVAGSPF